MPKPFLGCPQYFPPQKKSIFFQEQGDFLRKRVCGFSNWQLQENIFNRANLFGGAILLSSPHSTPRIQCLPVMLVHPSVRPAVCLSVCLFVCLSVHMEFPCQTSYYHTCQWHAITLQPSYHTCRCAIINDLEYHMCAHDHHHSIHSRLYTTHIHVFALCITSY